MERLINEGMATLITKNDKNYLNKVIHVNNVHYVQEEYGGVE